MAWAAGALLAAEPRFPQVPGVVVNHRPAASRTYLGSPSLAIWTNGSSGVSHDYFGPATQHNRVAVFGSDDRGQTWRPLPELEGGFWCSLFVHRGALYLMGTSRQDGDAVIRRSTDGGRSWTEPRDAQSGRLLGGGRYHCTPVPVVVHGGRLWRAMEDVRGPGSWGSNFRAFMLSSPEEADLLVAANWTQTIVLYHPDVVNTGSQYADWQFDGDDLIAAVRTAYDDGLGGAHGCHDANFITSHRLRRFRHLTMADAAPLAAEAAAAPSPGTRSPPADEPPPALRRDLARQILADPALRQVHQKARALLQTGLTAGSGYGEVWIRDLNTFLQLALDVNEPARFRESLLTFFKFQGPQGDIVDGYIPKERAQVAYRYRTSDLAPGLLAHKNTVETDQEASLVQAVAKYVRATGDRTFLAERVGDLQVRDRLARALDYVLTERFDPHHGLVWGATTADWGDVQPEHEWGVELDAASHRAIDVYDNAMIIIALDDFLQLAGDARPDTARWKERREALRHSIRRHLWDPRRGKFIPHLYLAGSPFPKEFDEQSIYYHGGTAVAIEANLLTRDEVAAALAHMRENVRRAGAASIGLTLYPPYPDGFFKNPSMSAYGYQNGGDWCWFGGRMVQQLIRLGFIQEAYRELRPMVERVQRHGDFHEWWSRDNQPRGSGRFRGSAGVLGQAIGQLLAWAERQTPSPPNGPHPPSPP